MRHRDLAPGESKADCLVHALFIARRSGDDVRVTWDGHSMIVQPFSTFERSAAQMDAIARDGAPTDRRRPRYANPDLSVHTC
jgi:hypothetical protein